MISSFTPSAGAAPTQVIISGQNFGISQGAVTLDGVAATVVASGWSQSQIIITLPQACTGPGSLQVRSFNGVIATAANKFNNTKCLHPDPNELQACLDEVGPNGYNNTYCTLGGGSFYIYDNDSTAPRPAGTFPPIRVSRGNVTISSSGGTLVSNMLLSQASTYTDNGIVYYNKTPMMTINFKGNTGGVVIDGLNFYNDPSPDREGNFIQVEQADIGSANSGVFTDTPDSGPYSLEIKNTSMFGGQSPNNSTTSNPYPHSFGIQVVYGETRADNIYFHNNTFERSTIGFYKSDSPKWFYSSAAVSTNCDSTDLLGRTFLNTTDSIASRNIFIMNNAFKNAGQGFLVFSPARQIHLLNNTFINDSGVHLSYTHEGGQIFIDQCVDTMMIENNTFTGAGAVADTRISGIEMYGRNITVRNNSISRMWLEGIGAGNTYNAKILNNFIYDNNYGAYVTGATLGGIQIWNLLPSVDMWKARAGSGMVISGNYFGNSSTGQNQVYGIRLGYYTYNPNWPGPLDPSIPQQPIPANTMIGPNNVFNFNGYANTTADGCYATQYTPLVNGIPIGITVTGGTVNWMPCP